MALPRQMRLGKFHGTIRVLFAGEHFSAALPNVREALNSIPNVGNVELLQAPRNKLAAAIQTAHVAIPFMERFDAIMLRKATELQCVIQFGVGLEGVDVEECSRLGIAVSNMPAQLSGNDVSTAEHALFLVLSLLRKHREMSKRFSASVLGLQPPVQQLHGKYVTVLGYGAIGQKLCRYLHMMGAHVICIRKTPWASGEADELTDRGSLEDLRTRFAQRSDVLVLACPLTAETKGVVNLSMVHALKPGCLVVNVGRGPLVDHGAVLEGLRSKRLGGFASDVGVGHPSKPPEPWDPTDELSQHPQVLFTPHSGGVTDVAYANMGRLCAEAILCVREGRPPSIWINHAAFSDASVTKSAL